ncbi:MAG: DNA polymerase III subunit beta [Muribaculaceae bacterium]|nr:DNA polymerase III subunit beta [Muribaculaceae bacterium]MDE6007726.1 DNA polymerase III subunit beta [Muribaculaceae bacterium]MDE6793438.1 DNA polymerase III subunit beta [Muribaculaceae bacterium]
MKFNIDGRLFQQQLQAVNKVISSKNALSILDNFLFELEGNQLTITGSDQENVVTARVEVADGDGIGAVAVPAKTLLEITKEISNQPLTFSLNDQTGEIDVIFLTGRFRFMGIQADEYPRGDKPEADAVTIEVPSSVVLKGIEKTIYAVSPETIRPMMTGIYWDIHEGDITFVASDTHKLVRYINAQADPGINKSFIMPAKPANILKGILGKEEQPVKIIIGKKGAKFEFGAYTLSCRFIKGNYPNYNRVIPTTNPFVVTVDRETFLNAMRRVAIFASKASNLVKLEITHDGMKLAAQDLDYGTSAEEKVMCEYKGNDMTIGFNSLFTVEILNNLNGETVLMKLSDPARPGIFEPQEQETNEHIVTIQMPMQVIE